MPQWTQVVIGIAAVIGAGIFLWTGVLKPIIRLGADTQKLEDRVKKLEERADNERD